MNLLEENKIVIIAHDRSWKGGIASGAIKKYLPAFWLVCILIIEVIYPVQAETSTPHAADRQVVLAADIKSASTSAYEENVQITTITPTPTVLPTATVVSNASPISAPQVINSPLSSSRGLDADVLFDLVNQFRGQNGLPPFVKDSTVCSIAAARAPEVYDEVYVNHDMHAGLFAMHMPYYITENIIYYHTEQGALEWWESSPVHRSQMLGNFKYSCTACSGNACSQVFTNY